MALIDPVPTPRLADLGTTHFIAIGGAGMSAVALGFLARSVPVSGCDRDDSPVLDDLRSLGANVSVGHDPAHLAGIDTVVVSSAIREDNPELVEARHLGLRVIHRSVALACLAEDKVTVSVAGTHGKTTTSAMCVTAAGATGLDVSFVIGGTMVSSGAGSHMGRDLPFIIEADESDGSFRQYPTRIAVVTNVESDHLDNWITVENYRNGFEQFAAAAHVDLLIADGDDPGARCLSEKMRASGRRVLTYGATGGNDLVIKDIDLAATGARAVFTTDSWEKAIALSVPGLHNLHNAAAAALVCEALGVPVGLAMKALEGFSGTHRRFERVGEAGGVTVVDDYAHHPTEVAAALDSAREVCQGKIIACFQPHLYSRTRDQALRFGEVLATADEALVLNIYAAREDPMPGVTSMLIVDATNAHGGHARLVSDLGDLPSAVAQVARPGDIVLTIGAGSITAAGPDILRELWH